MEIVETIYKGIIESSPKTLLDQIPIVLVRKTREEAVSSKLIQL